MGNEENVNNEEGVKSGTSRRTALKAGVAAGVGVVAWSVPSITSIGGTPVYAAGCTFVTYFKLANCRNTTQGGRNAGQGVSLGPWSYQPFDEFSGLTYTYTKNVNGANVPFNVQNTCCSENIKVVVGHPGLECKATVAIFPGNGECTAGTNATKSKIYPDPPGSSSLNQTTVFLDCLGLSSVVSQSRYSVTLACNTPGSDPSCLPSS
jgi:hypothetical protein